MTTTIAIAAGLRDGSAISTTDGALQQTRIQLAAAIDGMKRSALAAGKSFAQALSIDRTIPAQVRGGDSRAVGMSQAQRTLAGREAYHHRVAAEVDKYRAAYLSLAAKAREDAAVAVRGAARATKLNKDRLVKRAAWDSERAALLEDAAKRTMAVKSMVGEPEAVSIRAARKQAAAAGAAFASPDLARQVPVAIDNTGVFSGRYSAGMSLLPEFFPAEVQAASSALGGLGEGEPPQADWGTAALQALGIGANDVGNAAIEVGQETAKNNSAVGALVAALGGALRVVGGSLNAQFDRGMQGRAPAVEAAIPWGTFIAVGGAGLMAYLIYRAAAS